MLCGTTGAGKTTQLRDLIVQMRQRQDNAVVFDLTGAYVEAFYDTERDTILNPMDQRCPAWTIFNDCTSYSHFTAAAASLVPSAGGPSDPLDRQRVAEGGEVDARGNCGGRRRIKKK